MVVAISGYFNPIHKGHIRLINEAKKLGDTLVVILNNDYQVRVKGSFPFMNEDERKEILSNIKGVDRVEISIDKDRAQAKTLEWLRPDIFAQGGDRNPEESPLPESEIDVCKKNNIKIIYGVGGEKVESSSWIIDRMFAYLIDDKQSIIKKDEQLKKLKRKIKRNKTVNP